MLLTVICKSKNLASIYNTLGLTLAQMDIFDSPCLQSKDCQYLNKTIFVINIIIYKCLQHTNVL